MLKKWKLISSTQVFNAAPYITIDQRKYLLPNGSKGDSYFHLNRPDFVLIVAVNENNQFLLIKQYRRGVDDHVIEVPAGWIDKQETPQQAAQRELLEETGYQAKEIIPLGEIYAMPSFSSIKAFIFLAKIANRPDQEIATEADENLTSRLFTREKLVKMIAENKIKSMAGLSALNLAFHEINRAE